MFEESTAKSERGASDWLIRIGIALAFVYIGKDKFDGGEWVTIFQQIGLGQWFRYFTGVVEILGGVLVAIPWTVTAGLALLACTMACAAVADFYVGHPEFCMIPGGICVALVLFWIHRRD